MIVESVTNPDDGVTHAARWLIQPHSTEVDVFMLCDLVRSDAGAPRLTLVTWPIGTARVTCMACIAELGFDAGR